MTTLTVGQGQQYSTIASAVAASRDGDVIQVQAGVYTNDFATINTKITLQAVGGMVKMTATGNIPNGKGILITNTDVTIDGFEFSGAKVADANGAGIRYQAGNLTVTNSYFHDNQNGILSNPSDTGTITILNSEFDHNGVGGDGHTHNLYIGEIAKFTISNSLIHDAVIGHEIKSRAAENIITNNRIYDETGNSSYSIDLPNGGKATISGNVIQQSANGDNPNIIAYGEEGLAHSVNSATISNNVVLNDMSRGTFIWNASGSPITVTGTQVWNVPTMSSGSGVSISGTTQLSGEPALDLAHPWGASQTPSPPPPPPAGAAPVLSMGADVVHAEGNSGVTAFAFEAIRTGDLSGASSAKWTVDLGNMTASDFSGATSGTVNFAAGQAKAIITVNVQGDTVVEGDENFLVSLSNPTGATITTSTNAATNAIARGFVTNDDSATSPPPPPPPPASGAKPVLSMGADVVHAEGNSGVTAFAFEAIRTGDLSGASSAKWSVDLGNMTASDFFGATSGTVNFAAGQAKAIITVNVQGDTVVEGNENFLVSLSNPTGATITTSTNAATNAIARGFVTNDDSATSPPPPPPPAGAAPVLSMGADVVHAEGNSGVTAFAFEAIRTGDLSGASSAKWSVDLGNMTASDFSGATSGTVNFAAGQAKAIITVNVQGDTVVEGDENFLVSLSNPTGATITTSTNAATNAIARGFVTNDDSATSTAQSSSSWTGGSGAETKSGSASADILNGAGGSDSITGGDGDDSLVGDAGNDSLNGNAGADSLYGGGGVDTLYGSAGADHFIFRAASDSTLNARDTIRDFSPGQGDKIDLSGIDANSRVAGDQAFHGVWGYTKSPGELMILQEGDHWLVKADINGDGASDFAINVFSTVRPSGADFIF